MLLGLGTGVGRVAVLVQAALIGDAEGAVVVALYMDALDALGEQGDNVAVATDIVVVAALAVLCYATSNQVFNTEGAVALGGGAVDDQERDFLKGFHHS